MKRSGPFNRRGKGGSTRAEEAAVRQAGYTLLTTQEKINLLDERLGKGKGAIRQRKRLLNQLAAERKEKMQAAKEKV